MLLTDAVEWFTADHYPKITERTQRDYDDVFRRYIIPALGKMPLRRIDFAALSDFHASLKHIPRRANLSLATLSSLLSWAERRELRDLNSNPCSAIKKYAQANANGF